MRDLSTLQGALERRTAPLSVFFRDDDAGWADDHLARMCTLFQRRELPLDIAVIPQAVTEQSVSMLMHACRQSDSLVRLHQHGFSHCNHQLSGRSAEFGTDRPAAAQYADIERGRALLQARFGELVEPLFTPPWNRCSQATVAALEDLGIKGLSRIIGAEPLHTRQLIEMPVTIDWLKKRHGVRLDWQNFCDYAAPFLEQEPVVGIMLHHACMPDEELDALDTVLKLLKRTPGVSFTSMVEVVHATQ